MEVAAGQSLGVNTAQFGIAEIDAVDTSSHAQPTGEQRLREHLKRVDDGFRACGATARPQADPSWYAFQGYQVAAQGPGAGHLAWERIAPRFNSARLAVEGARARFEPKRVAFAMGYALGQRDQGQLTIAEADALLEGVIPRIPAPRPAYRTGRFWFLVAVLAAVVATAFISFETAGPEYPEISAPAFHTTYHSRSIALPAEPSERGGLSVEDERRLIERTVGGTLLVSDAVKQLEHLPYPQTARIVTRLMKRLDVADRLQLVEAVTRLPGGTSVPLLLKALHDPQSEVVAVTLGHLAGRGEKALLGKMPALLRHPDTRILRIAVESFGVIGTPETAWRIVGFLEHEDAELRQTARRALTQLVGKDYGPEGKDWLRHLPGSG